MCPLNARLQISTHGDVGAAITTIYKSPDMSFNKFVRFALIAIGLFIVIYPQRMHVHTQHVYPNAVLSATIYVSARIKSRNERSGCVNFAGTTRR